MAIRNVCFYTFIVARGLNLNLDLRNVLSFNFILSPRINVLKSKKRTKQIWRVMMTMHIAPIVSAPSASTVSFFFFLLCPPLLSSDSEKCKVKCTILAKSTKHIYRFAYCSVDDGLDMPSSIYDSVRAIRCFSGVHLGETINTFSGSCFAVKMAVCLSFYLKTRSDKYVLYF